MDNKFTSFFLKNIFVVVSFMFLFSSLEAQKNEFCLSHYQLVQLYKRSFLTTVSSLDEKQWTLIANKPNQQYSYDGEQLRFNAASWKNALSFDMIKLILYFDDNQSNIIEFITSEACYKNLFSALLKEFNGYYIEGEDSIAKYWHFNKPHDFTVTFRITKIGFPEYSVRYFNKTELDDRIITIKQEKQEKLAEENRKIEFVENGLVKAENLSNSSDFEQAMLVLDSLFNVLSEYNELILEKRASYKEQQKSHIMMLLLNEADSLYDQYELEKAKNVYQQLIEISPEHERASEQIVLIDKKIQILADRDSVVYSYAELQPYRYIALKNIIQEEMNRIIFYSNSGGAKIKFQINFDNDGFNNSNYTYIEDEFSSSKKDSVYFRIQQLFEHSMSSPLLTPTKIEDILVASVSEINLNLLWNSNKVMVHKKNKKTTLSPSDGFGSQKDTVLKMMNKNILLRSRGKYYFTVKNKYYNGTIFSDMSIQKYRTIGPEAMVYSLFPGLGTILATGGKKGVGSMVSTLIFYGLGIVAWQDSKQHFMIHEGLINPKYEWLGAIALGGIGAIIHISDIFTALSKGCKNLKESKKLRKELKQGPIFVKQAELIIE